MDDSVFHQAEKLELQTDLCRKSSIREVIPNFFGLGTSTRKKVEETNSDKYEKLWKILEAYIPTTTDAIQRSIISHVEYTLAKTRYNFNNEDCYRATAFSLRDRLIESLNDTLQYFYENDVKQCYYMSLEYLLGRAMQNAAVNLHIEEEYRKGLEDIGFDLEELYEHEHDPALGNGGLGRLAACYLDSMATLDYPCWGYGLRYTYGIFEQKIVNGYQVEYPDYWLVMENPWEICRYNTVYCVRTYGKVTTTFDSKTGRKRCIWSGGSVVEALAYDNPIPGYRTRNCINLRLWKATPSHEFDFGSFNSGNYMESVKERQDAESISAVLYPNDNTEKGKLLRLQQQYFFVCATIQDVLRRFKKRKKRDWTELPDKIVIQLNDTHPAIAIAELMRIFVDVERMDWQPAWSITKKIFRYTNHTILPEGSERWPQSLFEYLLPRHLLIINDINFEFLVEVRQVCGDNTSCLSRMSIYQEGTPKMIRMANLAIIGSSRINGVAAIHTHILKTQIFSDFCEYYEKKGEKDKFINITNGVTLRRWLNLCNPELSSLITEYLKTDEWLKNSLLLRNLMNYINDPTFVKKWRLVKQKRKDNLAAWVYKHCNVELDSQRMLFDIHVKRIHEYKRQLLNILYVLHRYLTLKTMTPEERTKAFVPRACMFGGKAAPGYMTAKTIIKFIHSVASWVNEDSDVSDFLKVVFLPNYNVSSAMVIISGADIGHHISTAGTEASGTSCIKLTLNGGLIIGTLDGANIEIRHAAGENTVFSFGLTIDQVDEAREQARCGNYAIDERLQRVLDYVRCKAKADPTDVALADFVNMFDTLSRNGNGHNGDYYLVFRDFKDFCRVQDDIDRTYRDEATWTRLCIKSCANMGRFSSDRSVKEYAEKIWNLEPCHLPPLK